MQAFLDDADRSETSEAPVGGKGRRSSFVDHRWIGDVLVLSPQGSLDVEVMSELVRALDDAVVAVVIDLDDCIMIDPGVFDLLRLDGIGHPVDQICITCRRLSARRILARSRALGRIVVFQRMEDALRARILEHNGMGRGWSLTS